MTIRLWFVRTDIGWIEVFNQQDPPTYSEVKESWKGRFIHPFGWRDVRALKMGLRANEMQGFDLVEWPILTRYYFERIEKNRIKLMRHRSWLPDLLIEPFCSRVVKALNAEHLPVGGRIQMIPLPVWSRILACYRAL